jgi:hypothetical protein
MPSSTLSHHLLNVLLQIANKLGLLKKISWDSTLLCSRATCTGDWANEVSAKSEFHQQMAEDALK